MYHYFEDKQFLKRAQGVCSSIMEDLVERLRSEEIPCQFFLVGSGGRNMITQNKEGLIDFDYNLHILNGFEYDEKKLKEAVRKAFNEIMRKRNLSDVSDSTSSLTTETIYFVEGPSTKFSIDVCIVTKDDYGNWNRLIHKKTGNTNNDRYYWNASPNSADYAMKTVVIKSIPRYWSKVRELYLKNKNRYLSQNDNNHPSIPFSLQ